MDPEIENHIYTIEDVGSKQYILYLKECLQECMKPISDTISRNKIRLFGANNVRQRSKVQRDVTTLKNNCQLFSRLFIACQARGGNLDDFFSNKNQATPPALSLIGNQGNKADLLKCIELHDNVVIYYC